MYTFRRLCSHYLDCLEFHLLSLQTGYEKKGNSYIFFLPNNLVSDIIEASRRKKRLKLESCL